nr:protein kinase [Kofleriaceae bacterium]
MGDDPIPSTLDAGSGVVAAGGASLRVVDRELYVHGREIARGGMGRIVEARDARLGRVVAVKELLRHDAETDGRFEREALISARLQHPAIVSIYEAGRWPSGEPFYAMKLVHGRSLDKVVAEAPTLAARLALIPSVLAVFDALAYAHAQRVIHRDLKPANVLIGQFGETVVIDWGLAKDLAAPPVVERPAADSAGTVGVLPTLHAAVAAPLPARDVATVSTSPPPEDGTIDGAVLGTPAYMPPEQARGERVDERADVYALGAVLYHVLAGHPPYPQRGAVAVLASVLAGPPPPIAEVVRDVPTDLATIVDTAMARDPRERYASAERLASELRQFQTGQLVASHAYTRAQLVRRWLRRNRAAAVVAIAAVAMGGAGAAVSIAQIVRERGAAEAGEAQARANLASAMVEKANDAEDEQRWDRAAVLFARARAEDEAHHADAAWRAGLAASHVIAATAAARAPGRLISMTAWSDGHVAVGLATGQVMVKAPADADWREVANVGAPVTAIAARADDVIAGDRDGKLSIIALHAHGTDGGAIRVQIPTGSAVLSIAVYDDPQLYATGHEDGVVRVWSGDSAEPKRVLPPHDQRVYKVRFARGGELASTSDDRTVRVWSSFSAAQPDASLLASATGGIKAFAWSPDGSLFATAGWDWQIKLWRTSTHELVRTWTDDNIVDDLVFSADGSWIASTGAARDVSLWDVETGARIARLGGHERDVVSAKVIGGHGLVTADQEGVVRWWNTTPAKDTLIALGHRGGIRSLAWVGDRIVSTSYDLTFRTWSVGGARPLLRIGVPGGTPQFFAVSRDGRTLATPGIDGALRVFSLDSGRVEATVDLKEHLGAVAVSPDGAWYAVGAASGHVFVVRTTTGEVVKEIAAHTHVAYDVAWSGDQLVTIGLDGFVRVWSMPDGAQLWGAKIERDGVTARASPDGRLVAVAGNDGSIDIVDVVARTSVTALQGKMRIWDLAFSPDDSMLAAATEDGSVRLWSLATKTAVGRLARQASRHTAQGLAFSGDGSGLAVGYSDGTIVVWDVATREPRVDLGALRSHGASSCAELERGAAGHGGDPSADELSHACTLPASLYLSYVESLTGLTGTGVELTRAPIE